MPGASMDSYGESCVKVCPLWENWPESVTAPTLTALESQAGNDNPLGTPLALVGA